MSVPAALLCLCLAAEPIRFDMRQVAERMPEQQEEESGRRPQRAVLLVQGLLPRPFSSTAAATPLMHGWQDPDGYMVTALRRDSDVYALSYSQNAPIETIAAQPGLAARMDQLKKKGYRELVVIGHSAGGVLARQFIEDHPDCGVTRFIQSSSPNGGSGWADADWCVPENQQPFLHSLTREGRRQARARRQGKKFPAHIEFVCVVGRLDLEVELRTSKQVFNDRWVQALLTKRYRGDGVVACPSQWPEELQAQGIPAELTPFDHYSMVRSPGGARCIAKMVRTPHPRWDAEAVRAARPRILGTSAESTVQVFYRQSRPEDDGIKFRLSVP